MPRSMKWAAAFCAVISSMLLWGCIRDLVQLYSADELREVLDQKLPADLSEELTIEMTRLQVQITSAHRDMLAALQFLELIAASGVFAATLRLMRPLGLRREPLRRLIATAALVLAILRTIDGAEKTGTAQSIARLIAAKASSLHFYQAGQTLLGIHVPADEFIDEFVRGQVGANLIAMVLMVLPMIFFWRYFGSEKAREIIAHEDAKLPDSRI